MTLLRFFRAFRAPPFRASIAALGLALPLVLFSTGAQAAFDITQLMQELAQHKGGRASFVEKKYLAILDKPLITKGEMRYQAPDRLEKRSTGPKPEVMILDKDTLTLERDQKTYTISLSQQPAARAFVDSIRGTLSGDRSALEKNYLLHLSGTREQWVLTLLPSDSQIATLVQRITVSGRQRQIATIEYLLADGDRTVLSIEPLNQP